MERKIIAYKHYFSEFVNSLKAEEVKNSATCLIC